MRDPNWAKPMIMRIIPDMMVASIRPLMPYCWTMPYRITMKAPVGPPIWTLLPPRNETRNPPTTALIGPFSGETPEAIAKAIAKGRATIPTIMPATTSFIIRSAVSSGKIENNFGLNIVSVGF